MFTHISILKLYRKLSVKYNSKFKRKHSKKALTMKFCELLLKNVKFIVFPAIKPVKFVFRLLLQVLKGATCILNLILFDILGNTICLPHVML